MKSSRNSKGFTLIEIIITVVISALAISALANIFFSQTARSVEPMMQIRAAKLGEALMDEILGKRYAEQTPVGGFPPCDNATVSCGPIGMDAGEFTTVDGEDVPNRAAFNDVDDYNGYCATRWPVEDVLGNTQVGGGNRLDDFQNFQMQICVSFDESYDGTNNGSQAKLIRISIFPPSGPGMGAPIDRKSTRLNSSH